MRKTTHSECVPSKYCDLFSFLFLIRIARSQVLHNPQGKKTDAENGRQCPFFEELHAFFTERARSMQRLLLESKSGTPQLKKKLKRLSSDLSSDDFSNDDDDDDEEDSEEESPTRSKKQKAERSRHQQSRAASMSIRDLLQEFLQQQQRTEANWWEKMKRRAKERQQFEQEWRKTMEKLQRERMVLEQAWREREDQRRMREESRAEKRDALLTTLLNKLI